MEVRSDFGAGYGDLHCPGCGVGLALGEVCDIPGCPNRGTRRRRGGTLSGAEALAQMGRARPAEVPDEDTLTRYERARGQYEAEAEYRAAYDQAKADEWLRDVAERVTEFRPEWSS